MVSNVEHIPVPYEVEKIVYVDKELSWWQTFVLWWGKVAWAIALICIVYYTNKRFRWINWLIRWFSGFNEILKSLE